MSAMFDHGMLAGLELAAIILRECEEDAADPFGRLRDAAIAIEAQRAVTTQIGTVRSTKARAGTASPNLPPQGTE